jgi:hypothetical protein
MGDDQEIPSKIKIYIKDGPDAIEAANKVKAILETCKVESPSLRYLGCGEAGADVIDVPDAGPWHIECAKAYMDKIDRKESKMTVDHEHPLQRHAENLPFWGDVKPWNEFAAIARRDGSCRGTLVGVVTPIDTERGIIALSDLSGLYEVAISPEGLKTYQGILKPGTPLVFEATAECTAHGRRSSPEGLAQDR